MNNEPEMNMPESEEPISSPSEKTDIASNEATEQILSEETKPASSEDKGGVKLLKYIFDFVEMLAVSVIVVLVVFTFCTRLCRVDGRSMNNTLYDKELLLTTNLFYEPEQGDIVVFHLSNEHYEQPLVKRVIAKEGQTVKVNFTSGQVSVDGVVLDERYIYIDGGIYQVKQEFDREYIFKEEGGDLYFEATVPEGHIFVMGDNRNHSTDSRSTLVGFVDEDCVIGKAILRIKPFTVFD